MHLHVRNVYYENVNDIILDINLLKTRIYDCCVLEHARARHGSQRIFAIQELHAGSQ